jgi:GTP-binding protein
MSLVAIVGRPNVGKSTLFNRIGKTRQALVDDFPGVTRDRNYVNVVWDGAPFTLVDTGGYVNTDASVLEERIREQVLAALDEADVILFVMDAKVGLHPEDVAFVEILRRVNKPVIYVANKVDGSEQKTYITEFFALGVENVHAVSAAHGVGIQGLMDEVIDALPREADEEEDEEEESSEIRIAIVGRPNVGKSTLVNSMLGTQRVIVSPIPGTTRDAVDTPFERDGMRYVLIDTAGIRRKGRTKDKLEKVSVLKALHSVDRCHIALIVADAEEGVTEQDLHVAGYVHERSRACIIVVNKWDMMENDPKRRHRFLADVRERFRFLPFAPVLPISAMAGKNVQKIIPLVRDVFTQYNQRITTGVVNRALERAVEKHEPPQVGAHRLKFYYATQASIRPPTFVVFCNRPELIHFSYERFLTNQFREAFGLSVTPVRILFRARKRRELS